MADPVELPVVDEGEDLDRKHCPISEGATPGEVVAGNLLGSTIDVDDDEDAGVL